MARRPEQVRFTSLGTSCAGDLYVPESDAPVPGLVLGHSGVMVKEALAVFAAHFVRAGFAVLAIDYRTVGASEGEPRGQDYPQRQAEDFRSAISYLSDRPEVDAARIGLWGAASGARSRCRPRSSTGARNASWCRAPACGTGGGTWSG